MRKRFHILCGIATAAFLFAALANAQTTVNKIVYTLNSTGTAYTVTGFEEGIVDAVIESAIDGKPVTTINQNVFKTASTLKSVKIPATITTMGNSIFQNNTSLETVTFEDGDQPLAMGGWTFNKCSSIKEIVLPGRLTSFGNNSNFNECSALTKVVFSQGCKLADLKQYTFEKTNLSQLDLSGIEKLTAFNANCLQNLKSTAVTVTLPLSSTPLPKDFLKNCLATTIIYPEGTTEISQNSLNGYTKVETLLLPSTLKTVGNSAFKGCTALKNITFAENSVMNSSLNYCFENCTALESIDMSPLKSVKGLVATFKNSGLKSITFGEDSKINTFNWDLFANTPIESIKCPATLTTIGARAFLNCSGINMLELPTGVNSINENAFGHDDGKEGVKCVVFNQQGGIWPALTPEGATESCTILGDGTKAYCYKDVESVPESVIKVAPIYAESVTTYFNSGCAIELPEGVKASTVSAITGSKPTLDFTKYIAGSVLPGNTPVILQCQQSGVIFYPKILPDGSLEPVSPNLLVGSENEASYQGNTVNYALAESNGAYCFSKVTGGSNPANHAYLALSESQAGNNETFALDDIASGMPSVIMDNDSDSKIFNLMGIEMNPENLRPGIYIRNGKKFIVKK